MPIYHYKDLPNILSEIKTGRIAPVFLVAGDAYLIQEVTGQLIDLLLPEEFRSFNLETTDGDKEDIYSILERIQTFPFFPGPKVVLVKNPVQLFSAGREDRLWKKAEEFWNAGQTSRCVQMLRTLSQNTGIALVGATSGEGAARALMEKLFSENMGAIPEWLGQALAYMKEHDGGGDPLPLSPDQILESALERGFPKNHVLILQLEGDPGGKRMVKAIAQKGLVLNFSFKQARKGEQTGTLKGFLNSRLSQEGKSIHPKAEVLLLERIAPEIFHLEMELQKLLSYLGQGKQIQPDHVAALVTGNREEPLYELTAVLGERRLEEGLKKLRHLWEQGYNPLQIMAGIANTVRRLLLARKILDAFSEEPRGIWQEFGLFSSRILPRLKPLPLPDLLSKLHPYVLYNTLRLAQRFSVQHLIAALETLHKADRLIKTGGATPSLLLEDFILSFCRRP
jgi:DNA polymerase-3 subunit delta